MFSLSLTVSFVSAFLTAIFHVQSRGRKLLAAGFTHNISASFLRRFLSVILRSATFTAIHRSGASCLKLLTAAFASQLERLSDGVFARFDQLVSFTASDTMPFQLLLPLDFFCRKLGRGKLKMSDEFQIDLDLLHSVAV